MNSSKFGLVLEGGGMRGIYTAGVLDVFMENDITFDGVIGVSAGAIHGGSYVSQQKGRNLRYYKKYCMDKRFISISNLLKTGDIVGEEFCYHTIPDMLDLFDYDTFRNSRTKFYCGCSNVRTGKAEYLPIEDMHRDIEVMRASASLPYFSRLVDINGEKYLDGGCTDSVPVEAFQKMGYNHNVVVLTRDNSYVKKEELSLLPKIMYRKYPEFAKALLNRHNNYNSTIKRICEMEKNGEIFVIRPEHPLNIGRLEKDPEKLHIIYNIGVRDAEKAMEAMKKWMNEKKSV